MRLSRVVLTLFAASALGVTAASAETFNFSFGTSADPFSGAGTLTGTLVAPGEFQITAVTGTTDTGNGTNRRIARLLDANTFENNDNLLFASSTGMFSFDLGGLSYQLGNGAEINLFQGLVGAGEVLQRANGNIVTESVPYSVTAATPEPGSFVLLGTGLLGLVGAARRRLAA